MVFRSAAQALLTRWYAAVAGLLLTAAAACTVFSLVPPSYSSGATEMFVQPRMGGGRSGNPLLDIDMTLNTTSSIVLQTLGTREAIADIKRSTGCSYKIEKSGSVIAVDPFIFISTQCDTPGESVALVNYFVDRTANVLADYQRELKVPQFRFIQVQTTVGPTRPLYVMVSRQTAVAGTVALLGIVITAATILLGERWARGRRETGALVPRTLDAIPGGPSFTVSADSAAVDKVVSNGNHRDALSLRW